MDYLECIKTKGQGTNYGVDIPPTQYMNIFFTTWLPLYLEMLKSVFVFLFSFGVLLFSFFPSSELLKASFGHVTQSLKIGLTRTKELHPWTKEQKGALGHSLSPITPNQPTMSLPKSISLIENLSHPPIGTRGRFSIYRGLEETVTPPIFGKYYSFFVFATFFRVSLISEYTLISEIIDDTKQVIIIPAALLLFSHLVPSLKFKPILTQSSPSYSNAHHTVGFKGTVAARSESFLAATLVMVGPYGFLDRRICKSSQWKVMKWHHSH